MNFTVEEENLMCIFNVTSRTALIDSIRAAVPDFDEPEILEIAESAMQKLDTMTDAEFAALILTPSYYNDGETEE